MHGEFFTPEDWFRPHRYHHGITGPGSRANGTPTKRPYGSVRQTVAVAPGAGRDSASM